MDSQDRTLEELAQRLEALTRVVDVLVIDHSRANLVEHGVDRDQMTDFRRRVAEYVAQIPFGETSTYGNVAAAAGSPGAYRGVGPALDVGLAHGLQLPWWRIVRSDGGLATWDNPTRRSAPQRELLRAEGVQL